jgi:hypothetical protein
VFVSRPEPLSILLCDDVQFDPVTQRKTLLGVYPHVAADSFPHVMPMAWLYVAFTGVCGALTLSVRIHDGATMLFQAGVRLQCCDADSTYELTVPLRGLRFPAPGVYRIEALAGGVVFSDHELRVTARTAAGSRSLELVSSARCTG